MESYKSNDQCIECVFQLVDIFNFTLNMHQCIPKGFDKRLAIHTKEKLLFLL